ncbi:MAG: carboxypeptidase regulatory-like domain-containing protein [Armatimonadetes bacterium]|nr:carboxypeptidase regulatory-like domain-containing protein [Armatimonadota bacterium]
MITYVDDASITVTKYAISGTITLDDAGDPTGTVVSCAGASTTVADSGGAYLLAVGPGTYTVTASKTLYTTTSAVPDVVVEDEDVPGVDIELPRVTTGTIEGTITDESGPVAGIIVTASDFVNHSLVPIDSAPTGIDGKYSVTVALTAPGSQGYFLAIKNMPVGKIVTTGPTYPIDPESGYPYGFSPPATDKDFVIGPDPDIVLDKLPSGAVAYWAFDNKLVDGAGGGNELTAKAGAAAYGNAKFGTNSLRLDGSTWLGTLSGAFPAGVPTGNSAYTVACFVKADPTTGSGNGGWLGYGAAGFTNGTLSMNFRMNGFSGVNVYWWNNDLGGNLPSGTFRTDWHSVVATYDGAIRTLYIDGQQRTQNSPAVPANVSNVRFEVGRTLGDANLTGWIDDLLILNRAMDLTEAVAYNTYGAQSIGTFTTIAASAIANGAITPSGTAIPVLVGTNKSFTITPAFGYEIDDVLADGVSVKGSLVMTGAVGVYTFVNVTNAPHTIVASFKALPKQPVSGNVNALVGGIGIVGAAVHFSTTPGGALASGVIATTVASPAGDYSLDCPPGDYYIAASAAGYISSAEVGPITVGASPVYDINFTLENGPARYECENFIANGTTSVNMGRSNNANDSAGARAAKQSPGGIGTLTMTVNVLTAGMYDMNMCTYFNGRQTFISVNGTALASNPVTSSGPDANGYCHNIVPVALAAGANTITLGNNIDWGPHLDYIEIPYASSGPAWTIIASVDPLATGGTISPVGSVGVAEGGSVTFTITPAYGKSIADVVVDDVPQGPSSTYTFSGIVANHTIVASFGGLPTFSGVVSGPSGPLYDAKVALSDGSSVRTNVAGEYLIVPPSDGDYTLTASKGGCVTGSVPVTMAGISQTVDFTLEKSAGLDPLVVLDASALTEGTDLASWPNTGSIGGNFTKAGATGPDVVADYNGKKAVVFAQTIDWNDQAGRRDLASTTILAPAEITGKSDWTISADLYRSIDQLNPNDPNVYFAWCKGWEENPTKRSALFGYSNGSWAYCHWGIDIWWNGSNRPSADAWHNVTITHTGVNDTGTNPTIIYVDGVAVQTNNTDPDIRPDQIMRVGATSWTTDLSVATMRFNGAIAKLQIFDQALSAGEVAIVSGLLTISGKVTLEDGTTPVEGATVSFTAGGTATTAADGTYSIIVNIGDSGVVSASKDGCTVTDPVDNAYTITVTDNTPDINFKMFVPTLINISGKVTLDDGITPVQGALVIGGTTSPLTDVNGEYTTTATSGTTVWISASKANHVTVLPVDGTYEVVVGTEDITGIDFRMTTGAVVVTVKDTSGNPIYNAVVQVGGTSGNAVITGADGKATFTAIALGETELYADALGYADNTQTITVAAGVNNRDVVLATKDESDASYIQNGGFEAVSGGKPTGWHDFAGSFMVGWIPGLGDDYISSTTEHVGGSLGAKYTPGSFGANYSFLAQEFPVVAGSTYNLYWKMKGDAGSTNIFQYISFRDGLGMEIAMYNDWNTNAPTAWTQFMPGPGMGSDFGGQKTRFAIPAGATVVNVLLGITDSFPTGKSLYFDDVVVDRVGPAIVTGPTYGANNKSVLTDDMLIGRTVKVWGKIISIDPGVSYVISDGYTTGVTIMGSTTQIVGDMAVVKGVVQADKSVTP